MIELFSQIGSVTLLGLLSFLICWAAKQKDFFKWKLYPEWISVTSIWTLFAPFAIYFIFEFVLTPLYLTLLKPFFNSTDAKIAYSCWLNVSLSGTMLLMLILYWRLLPSKIRLGIWKNPSAFTNYFNDLRQAFFGWCVAFPIVLFISHLLESLTLFIFNLKALPDQLAVYFIKMTFGYPLYFLLAAITIVIFAPCMEELLFRGFLQSFLRKHLGSKLAILVTAICFSLFHFSLSQGIGNLPIIGSLFPLAVFLGFIYEKQGSLFASICLHSMFNTVSIINLYLLGKLG